MNDNISLMNKYLELH